MGIYWEDDEPLPLAGNTKTSSSTAEAPPVLLLRMEEAAARLGIARTLMYQLVRDGQVESVTVGRLRRIPVACLDEFVDELRSRPRRQGSRSA